MLPISRLTGHSYLAWYYRLTERTDFIGMSDATANFSLRIAAAFPFDECRPTKLLCHKIGWEGDPDVSGRGVSCKLQFTSCSILTPLSEDARELSLCCHGVNEISCFHRPSKLCFFESSESTFGRRLGHIWTFDQVLALAPLLIELASVFRCKC